jgi:hypothetical protein
MASMAIVIRESASKAQRHTSLGQRPRESQNEKIIRAVGPFYLFIGVGACQTALKIELLILS